MSRANAPAFPRPHSWDESPITGRTPGDRPELADAQGGMTIREYYIAAILQGLAANPGVRVSTEGLQMVAQMADDMIEIASKPPRDKATPPIVIARGNLNGGH